MVDAHLPPSDSVCLRNFSPEVLCRHTLAEVLRFRWSFINESLFAHRFNYRPLAQVILYSGSDLASKQFWF